MSRHRTYKLKEVAAVVFVDEDGDFDPDVADFLYFYFLIQFKEQVCETRQLDSVEMTGRF